ncbi:MOSC N-terminal beta barrel domain-containing protein [Streptomyces sp. GQFP]|uniref:MOSC N-terminal beta barrel domain-containing protein n=1 Tax=Streptomyces sp. GQFP TaxID=2907545 RepID=UPI001F1C502B|nr:MOSC N-terminal beta barrel domain-containing protein [Streptomyces sp. GQFP]UIX31745.1 MOSC N-terminal beta barrel domain-containing protein [Streptomyces sp. GQFP]
MIGTVGSRCRYPVKSLLGEAITATEVTGHGLAHDRRLALVDTETGKIASAKHPRRWGRLLTLTAQLGAGAVRITAPDGEVWHSTDPDADHHLSDFIGRDVTLTDTPPAQPTLDRARPDDLLRGATDIGIDISHIGSAAPAGTFVDYAPVHLLTTAALARIDTRAPGAADAVRYRPNIVIDTPDDTGFPENDWPGRTLHIGDDLTLHVIARTPRCAAPTLAHGPHPRARPRTAEHGRPAGAGRAQPGRPAGLHGPDALRRSVRTGRRPGSDQARRHRSVGVTKKLPLPS